MKIANVRRRQAKAVTAARSKSPGGGDKAEKTAAPSSSSASTQGAADYRDLVDSPLFNSKHRFCFLCRHHEMPGLPGPEVDQPRGAWYCEDCRVNPDNNKRFILGQRVSVWWENDQQYYRGLVTAYEAQSGQHRVYYDVDHDWEFLDLSRQHIVFLLHEHLLFVV